jgi:hypothetical protein
MLFRTNTGQLIEINKYDFTNDKLYYKKLLELKIATPKLEKTFNNKNNKQPNK